MDPKASNHLVRLWMLLDKRALVLTVVCVATWRLLMQIPLADIGARFIAVRLQLYSGPGFFASIGANSIPFSAYSIGYEGIGPYVNALVIITLLAAASPRIRAHMKTEGGRLSLTRWSRALALLLALGQAYGWTVLAQSAGALPQLDWSGRLFACMMLTAGTAISILLAAAIDEFGLGFGYAAFILYAMQFVGTGVHRLADAITFQPSYDIALKAVFFGTVWSILGCAGCVAVVLAVSRVATPSEKGVRPRPAVEIPILVSGVYRPSQFAFAVMFLPSLAANYYVASNSAAVDWFRANWAPLGPSTWLDAAYIGLEVALVVLFAFFVAATDRLVARPEPGTWRVVQRLSLIAGASVAVLVVLMPIAQDLIEAKVSMFVPLGGFGLLIVTMLILIVVRAIEGRPLRTVSRLP